MRNCISQILKWQVNCKGTALRGWIVQLSKELSSFPEKAGISLSTQSRNFVLTVFEVGHDER